MELNDEIAMLDDLIKPLVGELAPGLLQATGIGVEIAGQLPVTAGDNPAGLPASRALRCCAALPRYRRPRARPSGTA